MRHADSISEWIASILWSLFGEYTLMVMVGFVVVVGLGILILGEFLGRKRRNNNADAPAEIGGQAAHSNETIEDARHFFHYMIAHMALHEACRHYPHGFFAAMASPSDRLNLIQSLWTSVSDRFEGPGEPSFGPEDIRITTSTILNYPLVLIIMPTPMLMVEAFMVAVIMMVKVEKLSEAPDDPVVRYFTLELGADDHNNPISVLCEWDQSGSHINYGEGPPLEELSGKSFIDALERYL